MEACAVASIQGAATTYSKKSIDPVVIKAAIKRMCAIPGRGAEVEPVLQAAVELLTLTGVTEDEVRELQQQAPEVAVLKLLDDDAADEPLSPDLGRALEESESYSRDPGALPGPGGCGQSVKQEGQGSALSQSPKSPLSPRRHALLQAMQRSKAAKAVATRKPKVKAVCISKGESQSQEHRQTIGLPCEIVFRQVGRSFLHRKNDFLRRFKAEPPVSFFHLYSDGPGGEKKCSHAAAADLCWIIFSVISAYNACLRNRCIISSRLHPEVRVP